MMKEISMSVHGTETDATVTFTSKHTSLAHAVMVHDEVAAILRRYSSDQTEANMMPQQGRWPKWKLLAQR